MITSKIISLIPVRRDGQNNNIATGGGGGGSAVGSTSTASSGSGGVTYIAGNGINISGTTLSVVFGTGSTVAACGSHLHTGVYLPIAGCAADSAKLGTHLPAWYAPIDSPVFTTCAKAPIICASSCATAPIVLASTCICSPIVIGSTCISSPLACLTNLTLACDAGTAAFTSGFAGSGWKLDNTGSSYDLEIDNLKVRNNLTAYQLEINEVNAVNGSLVVSSANGIAYCLNSTCIYFDTDGGANPISFASGDIIKAQVFTGAGVASYLGRVGTVYQCNTLGCAYMTTTTISGTPFNKMKLVQVGHCATAGRQNLIYASASDVNNPYIDMLAGVTDGNFSGKQKVRIGNLAGITDACFGGALSGYGLYSDNIYLKGCIVIAAGAGYSNLSDKPTTLAGINSAEGGKLTSVACNANYTTNTNQLTDGANLGGTAAWGGVSGAGKPADNATVGAAWGTNLTGIPAPLNTPTAAGLYLSSCYIGYYNGSSFPSYIDCSGNARFVNMVEFGTQTQMTNGSYYNTAIKGGEIWENSANATSTLFINYKGYQCGTSQYRNTLIGDGKGSVIMEFFPDAIQFGQCLCSAYNNIILGTGCVIAGGAVNSSSTMTATNFILSSDCRLKENIKGISAAMPVNVDYKQFNIINDPTQKRYGVLAQELQKTNPELVRTDAEGMLSVAYIDLLIKEVAYLKYKVEDYRKENKVMASSTNTTTFRN